MAIRLAVLGTVVLASLLPAPPVEWTRLTEPDLRNIDQVSLARTADGSLHLIWLRRSGTRWDLLQRTIDSAGVPAGGVRTAVTDWASLDQPFLMVNRNGGLRALLSGVRGSEPRDPYSGGIYTATAPAGGGEWSLAAGRLANARTVGAPAAVFGSDGAPVIAWASGTDLKLHRGMNPDQPDEPISATRCCAYLPALARDAASGEVVLGWYSNIRGEHGILSRTVAPLSEETFLAPGSATADRNGSHQPSQRVAVTARLGAPGVYLAYCAGYPTCRTVNLWRHGAPDPLVVAEVQRTRHVHASPGPEGRLWVMWEDGTTLRAARTNRAGTRFGPVLSAAAPAGATMVWTVTGEGSPGPLDLVATVQAPEGIAAWHTRLFPPLALSVDRSSVPANDTLGVTFRVTDAGDPVAGAAVSFGDQEGTTGAGGAWQVRLPAGARPGRITARAARPGYTPASAAVTLTAPRRAD